MVGNPLEPTEMGAAIVSLSNLTSTALSGRFTLANGATNLEQQGTTRLPRIAAVSMGLTTLPSLGPQVTQGQAHGSIKCTVHMPWHVTYNASATK